MNKLFVAMLLRSFVFFLLLFFSSNCIAQSLTGLSGGYSIPTAEFQSDKTIILGYNHLNNEFYTLYKPDKDYNFSVFYSTVTFLPFAEVSFRITYPNGYNSDPDNDNLIIGDRMISGRLQPLKEGKYIPSVVIGLQGFYKTTGDDLLNVDNNNASFFNSSYLVFSKSFKPKKIFTKILVSAGYGSDFIAANSHQFIGFFGGISFSPKMFEPLEVMLEYDADKWNIGTRVTLFDRIVILAGLEDMRVFSGGAAYKFNLP